MRTLEQDTLTLVCGCTASRPTKTSGPHVLNKCPEAERLWGELRQCRDEMQASPARGAGHKQAIDAFARARDSYHAHLFGEEAA